MARHYKDGIDAGYMAHPSFVDEDELEGFKAPLSIAAAETDTSEFSLFCLRTIPVSTTLIIPTQA